MQQKEITEYNRPSRAELSLYMYTHMHEGSLDFRNRVIHEAFHDACCHPKEKEKVLSCARQMQNDCCIFVIAISLIKNTGLPHH